MAQWTDTERSPHRSPQYNVLIGLGGVGSDGHINATNIIASHGLLNTNQCVQCHMHPEKAASPSALNPNYTGHDLQVRYDGCVLAGCHSSTNVALQLKAGTQSDTVQRMQAIVSLLGTWATNKAALNLRTNFGTRAWEYTVPGEFSDPTNNPSIVGPSSAQQALIPDTIKQARFNLYLVSHDASSGVHNGQYARWLLGVAQTNVLTELNKP